MHKKRRKQHYQTLYTNNITKHSIPTTLPNTLYQHYQTLYTYNITKHSIPTTLPNTLYLQHYQTVYTYNITKHSIPTTLPNTLYLQHYQTVYTYTPHITAANKPKSHTHTHTRARLSGLQQAARCRRQACSDSLRNSPFGVRAPVRVNLHSPVQTGSKGHTTFRKIATKALPRR